MRKFKKVILFLPVLFVVNILFAQSKDEGKRFLYYERYNSAISTFSKLGASGDAEAAYYLGQAHLGKEDVAGAR